MNSPRLVWGMTMRGGGWTFPVGALLGALYSILVIGSLFFISQVGGPGQQPPPPAALLISMAIILGLGGGLVGGVIGLVFGPIGGLFCALLTRFLLSPGPDPRRYARIVARVGAAYGAVAAPIGLWIISGFNIPPPTGQTGNTLLFYILPALVAAAAGAFIARQITDWYQEATTSDRAPAESRDAVSSPRPATP